MPKSATQHYPKMDANPDFPKVEEAVLSAWKDSGAFKNSISNREKADEYIFYDGPPFANGLPHYGHLLTGYVKDVFARYQTMNGKRVDRRFGWDCHGLPAEMGSEKELKISGRQAIQNFGIDKFNEHCRTSVMKFTGEWEDYVTRQARWVDFQNDYKTMDTNFMESVLWAFKQLYDKGLVYEAYRVMPYSWAAETPLSNFETKLDNSYREREDKAITVAFELNEGPKELVKLWPNVKSWKVLAWTTTPWTLPSNLALAVGRDVKYKAYIHNDQCIICSKQAGLKATGFPSIFFGSTNMSEDEVSDRIDALNTESPTVKAKELIGLTYKPLFPYFEGHADAFKILDGSDFVTDGDGTGIVHMAPGFGEDDQKTCEAAGIKLVVPVDEKGRYTDEIHDLDDLSLKGLNVISETEGQLEGEPFKPEQVAKYGLVNLRIIHWLKVHNKLIKQEDYKHNYPHCWRTDMPLIYRALPSWYVEVTKFRDRAVELNKQINWIPAHVRDGQMGHMLATAPDWSISRNRFWGTPIPVWRSESGKLKVCGSIAEIEELSGKQVKDLHRPYIDDVTFEIDGETYTRVDDVFDCWFESGSMPFAQVHYPFENKEWFDSHFPADFITEYVGQTRGWFNTLIMLSTALFDKAPFKNCICHGVVLDSETGLKYSKRLKNYKDPMEVMDKYGADALRWLMIASPVMRGMDLSVDPEGKFIRDVVRLYIKPIWNAYNFFSLYANADGIEAKLVTQQDDGKLTATPDDNNLMDAYILAKCNEAVEKIKTHMDAYNTPDSCQAVVDFFEVLNNWYIRRNKERFWKEQQDEDKQAAYDTLYTVLHTMCRAAAPLLPLTLDEIYRGLTGEESVHLVDYPHMGIAHSAQLIHDMDWAQQICNAALSVRNKTNIRVRQPLASLKVVGKLLHTDSLGTIICDEVNVKNISISPNEDITAFAALKLSINNKVLGKRLPALMKQIIPASKKGEWKQLPDGGIEICGEVLQPEEYEIQLEPKGEYKDRAQALSSNDALVILDTEITPELAAEGIARDMVRAIQQARKDGGLHVSDRIKLHLAAPDGIAAALLANKDEIMKQTLTTEWLDSEPAQKIFSTKTAIDDKEVVINLSSAA